MAEHIYLSGKIKWANRLYRPDEKFNKWSIVLYPDAKSLEEIRELQASKGLKNQMKKDEDGYNMTFSRPVSKIYKGVVKTFTPPVITDKDRVPIEGGIGNGSDATLKIEVYPYTAPGSLSKSHAVRLEAVRIDNLVPYNPDTDYPEEQREQIKGLEDQPTPLF